jgi:hypothetical protein
VIHHPAFWVLAVISAAAAAYQAIALVATIRHFRGRVDGAPGFAPPISILKPMYGSSPGLYAALRSHAVQDYPKFEIVFGVRTLDDPCLADIERLRCEFPNLRIRLVQCHRKTPNGKVGVLADLVREARHPLLLVNDDDITVPAGYLRDVVAPMADPATGIVTCLYRATADHSPGRWEGLGIVTDFAPSTLVAPFVGVSEFGLGSTIVFRREDLNGHRRIRSHCRLHRRRLPTGRAHSPAGTPQRDFARGCRNASRCPVMERRLAASGALGADHPFVARRLCRAVHHIRHVLGAGGCRVRLLVAGSAFIRPAHDHGDDGGMVGNAQPVTCCASGRSFRCATSGRLPCG